MMNKHDNDDERLTLMLFPSLSPFNKLKTKQ